MEALMKCSVNKCFHASNASQARKCGGDLWVLRSLVILHQKNPRVILTDAWLRTGFWKYIKQGNFHEPIERPTCKLNWWNETLVLRSKGRSTIDASPVSVVLWSTSYKVPSLSWQPQAIEDGHWTIAQSYFAITKFFKNIQHDQGRRASQVDITMLRFRSLQWAIKLRVGIHGDYFWKNRLRQSTKKKF